MIDTASIKGQMQPWYYRNAKSYNNELLTAAVNKEAANAQRQGTDYNFQAEYKKTAQKLGLFDPTGNIHLAADFTLSDRDRAIFENMDKDAKAQGMPRHVVDDAAMFFKMDGLLADNSGGLPLDKNYFQRLIDDFKRENSPVRSSNLNPASMQYFKDNFSRYIRERPTTLTAAPASVTGADGLHPAAAFHSFPSSDAPVRVKKAYEAASMGMSSKQKAIAGMPFRAMEISANIKYDPQGNPVGTYLPGEAGYRNVYDEPEFSYLKLVEQGLKIIEPHKNYSPETYQIQKNFLELFKSKLQAYGIE